MIWQDYVISLAAAGFAAFLWPTVVGKSARVPRWTSGPTALLVLAMAAAQWSLGARLGPALEVVGACLWGWVYLRRATRPPAEVTITPHERRKLNEALRFIARLARRQGLKWTLQFDRADD